MAGWRIELTEFRNALAEYGVHATAGSTPDLILQRLSHGSERDTFFTITQGDILKDIYAAQRDTRHWMHAANPRVLAATLMALERFVDPEFSVPPQEGIKILEGMETRKDFDEFLERYETSELVYGSILMTGAAEFMTTVKDGLAHLFTDGATLMVDAGDSADIRINTLLSKAIRAFERMKKPPLVRFEQQAQAFHDKGWPRPKSYIEVLAIKLELARALQEHPSEQDVLELLKAGSPLREKFENLLRFLGAFARPGVAAQALESLILLNSDAYTRRAASPIGIPTEFYPPFDPEDKESVLAFFIHQLGIPIETEKQREAVWQFWREARGENMIGAETACFDFDDCLMDAGFGGYPKTILGWIIGMELVKLREVMFQLAAVAHRDKKPIAITTTCGTSRLVDMINDPRFALLKYVLTLRGPDDPTVSIEEVLSTDWMMTYEKAVGRTTARFSEFEQARAAEMWIRRSLFAALVSLSGLVKDLPNISRNLHFLVDNKRKNLLAFLRGGGKMGVLVAARHHDTRSTGRYVADVWGALRNAVETASRLEGTGLPRERIVDARLTPTRNRLRETDFPQVETLLWHSDWFLKVASSWIKYWLEFQFQKPRFRWFMSRFTRAGRALRKEAAGFLRTIYDARVLWRTQQEIPGPSPVALPPSRPLLAPEERATLFPFVDPASLVANPIAQLFEWSQPLLGLAREDFELIQKGETDAIRKAIFNGMRGYEQAPGEQETASFADDIVSLYSLLSGYDLLVLVAAAQGRQITGSNIDLVLQMIRWRVSTLTVDRLEELRPSVLLGTPEGTSLPKVDHEALAYSNPEANVTLPYLRKYFSNVDWKKVFESQVAGILGLKARIVLKISAAEMVLLRRYAVTRDTIKLLTYAIDKQKPYADLALQWRGVIESLEDTDKLAFFLALFSGSLNDADRALNLLTYMGQATTTQSRSRHPIPLSTILSPIGPRQKTPPPPARRSQPQGELAIRTSGLAVVREPGPKNEDPGNGSTPTAFLGGAIMAGDPASFHGATALEVGRIQITEAAPLLTQASPQRTDEEPHRANGSNVVSLRGWKNAHWRRLPGLRSLSPRGKAAQTTPRFSK
ncbi:MAG: hypothetical protein Q7T11_03030 [Deltaproteobacteria bacterium]|nr:hypothetical protein [Deltaproteobacteria bacterium]